MEKIFRVGASDWDRTRVLDLSVAEHHKHKANHLGPVVQTNDVVS